ncbi:MAG: hypothetical protein IIU11_04385 [Bacteroidales bacterium]|nr:hypothetical protein [Bacteroidales bacterium]MBQ5452287.1 hypothetical protein [Bacteroidales bacterium]
MTVQKNVKKHHNGTDAKLLIRKHRQSFMLNELELQALTKYFKKYKVKNHAKFLRETVMTAVIKRFEDDYPRLFEDSDSQNKENTIQF